VIFAICAVILPTPMGGVFKMRCDFVSKTLKTLKNSQKKTAENLPSFFVIYGKASLNLKIVI
jgi:hypothetical protein